MVALSDAALAAQVSTLRRRLDVAGFTDAGPLTLGGPPVDAVVVWADRPEPTRSKSPLHIMEQEVTANCPHFGGDDSGGITSPERGHSHFR